MPGHSRYPSDDTDPPWLRLARLELAAGVAEISGPKSNARIDQYHAATRGGPLPQDADSVPWCSSFVCWCMEQSGIASTRFKAARSWLTWGSEIAAPVPGCVVVLWRVSPRSGKGHVGLYVGKDDQGRVLLLGGNQGDRVSVRPYQPSRVLSHRWPRVG
jgi:uncharacterized protein (TIGR02594 family)